MTNEKKMINHALSGKFGSTETEAQTNEVLNALLEDDFIMENFLDYGKFHAENKGDAKKVELYEILLESMSRDSNGLPLTDSDIKGILTHNTDYAEVFVDYIEYKKGAL